MADDAQWPSEDEDFDAVAEGDSKKSRKTVTVVDDNSSDQAEAAESPAAEETQTNEPAAEEAAPAEPAASEAVNETSEEEVQPEPQAAAVVAAPVGVSKPKSKPSLPHFNARTVLEVVLAVLVIGLALWAWNLQADRKNLQDQVSKLNANPQIAVQKQTQDLINRVGRLIQLPTGEAPTVANVSDAAQAKQQSAFFNNAVNGDKVLMYVKAGEAILYRPSTDRIILVAPLTFNNNAATTPAKTTTPAKSTTTKP